MRSKLVRLPLPQSLPPSASSSPQADLSARQLLPTMSCCASSRPSDRSLASRLSGTVRCCSRSMPSGSGATSAESDAVTAGVRVRRCGCEGASSPLLLNSRRLTVTTRAQSSSSSSRPATSSSPTRLPVAYGLQDALVRGSDLAPDPESLSPKMVADAFEAQLGVLYCEATIDDRLEVVRVVHPGPARRRCVPDFVRVRLQPRRLRGNVHVQHGDQLSDAPCVPLLEASDSSPVSRRLASSQSTPRQTRAHDPYSAQVTRSPRSSTRERLHPALGRASCGTASGFNLGRGQASKRWNARLLAVGDCCEGRTPEQLEAFAQGTGEA